MVSGIHINKEHILIEITGLVQGLGFRPFVYRLAKQNLLNGWVANTHQGISISIEGLPIQQQNFLTELQNQLPPFAKIDSLSIQKKPLLDYADFQIKASSTDGQYSAFVLPDISPCTDCMSDILNPQSRYYHYPFTSCSYCGPRYSIMKQQPYDRMRTSMAGFIACPECLTEYSALENRRFHSQTIACPQCGPQLSLLNDDGISLYQSEQALSNTIELLKQGKIIAIKAVGGFQLLADASNQRAVEKLRLKKLRPEKPFALLVENLANAKSLCHISLNEQQTLSSHASPIVLLKHQKSTYIVDAVAPNNALLGVMLPASPLQYLLAREFKKPLVATSGNREGEPIIFSNHRALERLGNIADYFLTHNREIIRPLDDSIVRCINNKSTVLRRARGYVPLPVTISKQLSDTLAVGGQMKNTIAINVGKHLILSQHIGNLDTTNSQQQFQQSITDLQSFYSAKPSTVVHDLHADYYSSFVASQQGLNKLSVQHHHAHVLSCMAEHDLQIPVLGFAWDGTGLGTDNTSWGGECLVVARGGFQRYAHFRLFPLLGGDKAATEPRRSALGLLYEIYGDELFEHDNLELLTTFSERELILLKHSLDKKLNTPYTSSVGRLFDAVSSLLGLSHLNQFEGQAAILLEQMASTLITEDYYPFELDLEKQPIVIDWQTFIVALLADMKTLSKNLIAAKFHNTLAEIALQIAQHAGQRNIVLSGGCFQNAYLTEKCVTKLKNAGFSVYTHENIPPNDGGLALGQLYAAVFI